MLSLQSQHDSAGSRASPNHTFSMLFQAMFSSVLLRLSFFDFFVMFNDFGRPSEASLVPLWGAKEPKKGILFLESYQEGPWEGLGSDF